MKKLILAALLSTAFIVPAIADEAMTLAADMAATTIVYVIECKPSEKMKNQMIEVSRLFVDAAGVDFSNRQFFAMVTIKTQEFTREAKANPSFCRLMAAAYEKGRSEQ